MKTEERIAKQRQLVEEMGIHFDKQGFQPIAGRILGLLTVMDKEEYTFEEITEELSISKSSASVALRNLEIRGNIEYITIPGDRKRYFRAKTMNPTMLIDEFASKLTSFQKMHKEVLELKANKDSRVSVFMLELNKMMEFFLANMDHLKQKFRELENQES